MHLKASCVCFVSVSGHMGVSRKKNEIHKELFN